MSKRKISFVDLNAHSQTAYIQSCLQLCIDTCSMFIFSKRNPNLILAFDLRIFYFVSKSDCNIRLIVFQTTSFGFYIFEVFSRLLSSRRRLQDVQTETIRSERVDNHLCLRVLMHAQQQDKLNAKRLIHGICSIFRLFLYQINTKFVLTVSRRSISCPAFTNISTIHLSLIHI